MKNCIFVLVALLVATQGSLTHEEDRVEDAIIIGAGMAGLGASVELSKNNISHLILEARERIGGRVYAT